MENPVLLIVALLVGIAIGYFICKKLSNGGNHHEKPPHGIISVEEAIDLHEEYVDKRYPIINNSIHKGFKDTQFVWFSFHKIKSYIEYLETVQHKNPSNEKISGIRVYFGAYEKHDEYPKQQTVFFNPTIETELKESSSNMKNLPFSIIPTNTSDPLVGKYKIIERLLIDEHNPTERAFQANNSLGHKKSAENLVQKSNAENGDDNGTSLSFNMGQLSPPPPRG